MAYTGRRAVAETSRQPGPAPGTGEGTVKDADPTRQRKVVDAFLAASRDDNFEALLALLDPEAVLRAGFEFKITGGKSSKSTP